MKDKEKDIIEYNNRFIKKVLKSALYTFFIFLLTVFVLIIGSDLIFHGSDDASLIISFCISIIFTIFYCTLTIIEEIRKIK